MQNLKYLERVIDEDERFGIILNKYAVKHTEHIQQQIALSLLEFFNEGKFVDENDIEKIDDVFYVSKEKYFVSPQSKVFSIRVNTNDSEEKINSKITELKQKIKKYRTK